MADFSSTVELIFQGTNRIGPVLNDTIDDVDRLNRRFRDTLAPVAALTTGIIALEAAIAAAAVAFGRQSVDAALEFARAQTEVRQVTDATAEELSALQPEITELARIYNRSSAEILQGTADFARAGFETEAAIRAAEIGIRGAVAAQSDFATVTTGLRASLAGYGISADDTARSLGAMEEILNILNFTAQNTNTDFDELLVSFQRLSPIARVAGLDFYEAAAAAAAVTEVFQRGTLGAEGYNSILSQLTGNLPRVQQALAQLGISQTDQNGQLREGADIFSELVTVLQGYETTQQLVLAQQLVGIDQADTLLAATAGYNRVLAELSDRTAVQSSVQREFNIVAQTAGFAISGLGVAYGELNRAVGVELLPGLADVSNAFTEVLNVTEDLVAQGALDEFFANFEFIFAQVVRIAQDTAQALPEAIASADFSGITRGIEALFGNLEEIDITAEGLARTITAAADAFATLSGFTALVIDVIQGLAVVIGPLVSAFNFLGEGATELFGTLTAGIAIFAGISLAISGAVSVYTTLSGVFGLVSSAGIALNATLTASAAAATGFGAAMSRVALGVAALAGPVGLGLLVGQLLAMAASSDAVKNAFSAAFDGIIGFIDAYVIDIRDAEQETQQLGDTSNFVADNIAGLGSDINKTTGEVGGLENQLASLAEGSREVSTVIDEANTKIKELEVIGPIPFIDLTGADQATAPIEGLVRTVDDAGNVISETFVDISDTVKQTTSEQNQSIDEAIKKTEEYELRLLEIASNERIKVIEASVEFNIAQLQADTAQIEAAFASIDNTVNSTGDLIGDLFGVLDNFGRFDQLRVFDQIEKENARRQVALDLQADLIEAQIAKMRAQTRALAKGQAFFHIDASPLAPHLQAILHEMISQTQIQASADGLELLLNINAPPTLG